MFGPYRTCPEPPHRASTRSQEEIVLGWALVVLGGLRIAVALVTGETWAAEATIAALMMPAGVRLLTCQRPRFVRAPAPVPLHRYRLRDT